LSFASRSAPSADPLAALAGPLRPYYLLHGEETYLVERGITLLRERLAPAGKPGSWSTLWGEDGAEQLAGALADLQSPSLFGGVQTLAVRHVEALRDSEQSLLLEALPSLGGHLVLVGRSVDLRRRLFAACAKAGAAVAFPPLGDLRAAQPWVARLAHEQNLALTPAAAQELLDRSGTDLGALASEIAKLAVQAGTKRRIEPDDVRRLVADVRTHGAEELTARLAHRDLRGAAAELRHLLAQGEPPLRLVAFLATNLRRALHVAELADQGLSQDAIAQQVGMPAWLVARNLGRGTARDLQRALCLLRGLDLDLKRSRPTEAVFEAVLLELAAD